MGNKSSKRESKPLNNKPKGGPKSVDDEDIILKCGLEEMVKRFFKDWVIVWHDPNIGSQENKNYKDQLEKFCEVKTFTEWEKAAEFILRANAVCQMITSGTNGELLVKEISSSQNVSSIYIFCGNRDYHSIWARRYSKVRCVETDMQQVLYLIEQNILKWYKEASSLRVNLPAFAPIFDDWDKSEMNNLHRYLKVVPNFKNRLQAKEDLVNLARTIYSDETNLSYIDAFEETYSEYNKEAIMKWYTQESFLYKITNNCLRIATSDSIQYCRLLLKDIEQAIKEQYKEKSKHFCGVLYRGAYLSQEEWASLKANLGGEIEMHGFLSVSKVKNVALHFMQENPNQKVFITILVPKGPNEEDQEFAEVEEFSNYPQEKEILFNVRSRFTVLEAEDSFAQGLPYRHLVLLYGAQGFRRYIAEENPMEDISIPNVENIACSVCSCHRISTKMFFRPIINGSYFCEGCLPDFLANHNGPFACLPMMYDSRTIELDMKGFALNYPMELKLPMYGYKCSQCHAEYREIYFKCTECSRERKKVWCENCLESQMDCIQKGHGIVLESNPFSFWCEGMSENELAHIEYQDLLMEINPVIQQAEMYFESNQYKKAIEYYNIYIQQHSQDKKSINLALAYHNLAYAYENQGEYNKALENIFKGLKMYKSCKERDANGLSPYYENIGVIYQSLGEYKESLKYLEKDLKIIISAKGEIHRNVAAAYNCMGTVYFRQGEVKKSLECFEKALEINKELYESAHPNIASSYNNIGNIYQARGELNKALGCFEKALEITKSLYGDNHPEVADYYNNIGEIWTLKGEYKEALEYTSKALKIMRSFNGENHPHTAVMYASLGQIFTGQGENNKALEYYFKALEIWSPTFKSSQAEIIACYDGIGKAYENIGQYEKALEYFNKALEIKKSMYKDNHYEIATSLNNIGSVLYHKGEFGQALEHLYKGLEIRKAFFGNNHFDIATSYRNIGLVYDSLRQYNRALEYYSKALEIRTLVFGQHHLFTVEVANQIEKIGKSGRIKQQRELSDLEIRRN